MAICEAHNFLSADITNLENFYFSVIGTFQFYIEIAKMYAILKLMVEMQQESC